MRNGFVLLVTFFFVTTMLGQHEEENIVGDSISASVYSKKEVTKSNFYISLWGDRYREEYGTKIKAKSIQLDTFSGGIQSVLPYGTTQAKSLLLTDRTGKEYVMRAVRKSPTAYYNNTRLKNEYEKGELEGTYTGDFIEDFATGTHPYISLTTTSLANSLGIPYPNTQLFYVPEQEVLEDYDYGNALCFIEERIPEKMLFSQKIDSSKAVSTKQLLKLLQKDVHVKIDEVAYIKARVFDMLMGNRRRRDHQWLWVPFHKDFEIIYKPVSTANDQAFSKMGDGPFMRLGTYFSKKLKHLQSYEADGGNPKWMNKNAFALDKIFTKQSGKEIWDAQVKSIQNGLTNRVINEAFNTLPKELDKQIPALLKEELAIRRDMLQDIIDRYYKQLQKTIILIGTDKEDTITIENNSDGSTHISMSVKDEKGQKEVFFQQTYTSLNTRRIWLYGLEGTDIFIVKGETKNKIPVTIIGGKDKDTYMVENNRNITIYDYASEANAVASHSVKVKPIHEKEAGNYDYKKQRLYTNRVKPLIGVNVDDGLRLGVENTFTKYNFQHLPYAQQHVLGADFYFATRGFDVRYSGQWNHIYNNLNLGIDLRLTSPNYTINFFGFGNNTKNLNVENKDDFGLDFNRVRVQTLSAAPSVSYNSSMGYSLKGSVQYATISIEKTAGRFIEDFFNANNNETINNFAEIYMNGKYSNAEQNVVAFLDLETDVTAGYTYNTTKQTGVLYAKPFIKASYPAFSANSRLQLSSTLSSHINFGDDLEFYQGATLGASTNLRGYRHQRFTGQNSFVHSSDIKVKLNRLRTRLIPVDVGIYGGFDYGRVWVANDTSTKWNNALGGGLFFNTSGLFLGNISAFHGNDGVRVAVKLRFGF